MSLPVPVTVVWLTAFVSIALTTFLAYALRGRFGFATLCVMGIGVAPLILYLVIFTPFHIRGASPLMTVPFWDGFQAMALFVAPNYLLSFVISGAFLPASWIWRSTMQAAPVIVVVLLPVHGLGLY